MILPYLPRLLSLCLACFFLVHLATGMMVAVAAPAAIWVAERMRPRSAARFLLMVRLLPCGVALLAIAAFCLPSYLSFEPKASLEQVGVLCLAGAVLTLAVWARSTLRAWRALTNSRAYLRKCGHIARTVHLRRESPPLWVLEGETPLLALVGIFRSRIVISRSVLSVLSPAELRAAVRHEHAHGVSRDNFKRLLLLLAPDVLPFVPVFRRIEVEWARFTEWAADDEAAAGNSRNALSLAATLIRVARICGVPEPAPLVTSLVATSSDVPARVERLLAARSRRKDSQKWLKGALATACLTVSGCLIAPLFDPAAVRSVHLLLEHLIH